MTSGGGTFDISVLEIGDGVFEVKSTNGDTFLGGEDFDMRLVEYLAAEFKKEQGIDLKNDKLACSGSRRRREGQDRAVVVRQTEINLPFITPDQTGPEAPDDEAHPRQVRALVDDLVQRTIEPCKAGCSRMPGLAAARSTRCAGLAA
jgi:molecular chaperone DnaK